MKDRSIDHQRLLIEGGSKQLMLICGPETSETCIGDRRRRQRADRTVKISVHPSTYEFSPHFNGTGSVCTFVSVNRRNNEARAAHTTYPCTELVALKRGNLAAKYPWMYGYFYSVGEKVSKAR